MTVTRRRFFELTVAAAALARSRAAFAEKPSLITRAIPSSGEKLPMIGLGTNRYGVTAADEIAARREVLRRMPELGATVIDTAPAYGQSEEVIGRLLSELKNRDRVWLATKVTAPSGRAAEGRKMLEESFRRLRTERIQLVQVHSLQGVPEMLPVLREQKKAGKLSYVGVTRRAMASMMICSGSCARSSSTSSRWTTRSPIAMRRTRSFRWPRRAAWRCW